MSAPPQRPIAEVLAEHSPAIMAMPGVTAIGEGRTSADRPCIRIYLRARDRALEERLPREIEGYPVEVRVSGEIRALPDSR